MAHLRVLLQFCIETVRLVIGERHRIDNELYLKAVYRAFLKRDPDAAGLKYYLTALQRRTLTHFGVIRSVLNSSEFRNVYKLPVHPLNALHQARMMLVQNYLPAAQYIVDLGGAAPGHPEGALLAMGYPHQPREIVIVDLPPTTLLGKQYNTWLTPDGILIRYHYGSMTDLSWLPDNSVDLVWAGQSIEHVTEDEAEITARQVFRVLRPNGYFCLDTPNAALTRLQSPDKLIHPEHKKEYRVSELKDLLESIGFEIVEAKGICPMPNSLRTGIFDLKEIVHNITLSDEPEYGYLFFLKAMKR